MISPVFALSMLYPPHSLSSTLIKIYAPVTLSKQVFTSDTTARASVVAFQGVPFAPLAVDPRSTSTLRGHAIVIPFKTFGSASPTLSSRFQRSPKLSSVSLTLTTPKKLLNPLKLSVPGYTALLLTPLSSAQHTPTYTTSFMLSFSQPPNCRPYIGLPQQSKPPYAWSPYNPPLPRNSNTVITTRNPTSFMYL